MEVPEGAVAVVLAVAGGEGAFVACSNVGGPDSCMYVHTYIHTCVNFCERLKRYGGVSLFTFIYLWGSFAHTHVHRDRDK